MAGYGTTAAERAFWAVHFGWVSTGATRTCEISCASATVNGLRQAVTRTRSRWPIECVAPGHGWICCADIEAEIESLVEIFVELDKRLVLECGCAPKRCHLACIAVKCNTLIRGKRALRSEQAADARDAGGAAACEQCGEGVVQEGGGAADVDAPKAKAVADDVAQECDGSGVVEAGTDEEHDEVNMSRKK